MSKQTISKEQVKHVAKLSNLEITEEELEKYSAWFSETMKYIEQLDEIDTSEAKGTYEVTGLTNVFSKDNDNKATLDQKDALFNAKKTDKGLFVTEAVFDR